VPVEFSAPVAPAQSALHALQVGISGCGGFRCVGSRELLALLLFLCALLVELGLLSFGILALGFLLFCLLALRLFLLVLQPFRVELLLLFELGLLDRDLRIGCRLRRRLLGLRRGWWRLDLRRWLGLRCRLRRCRARRGGLRHGRP